jgi:hypothetical protein
MKGKKQRIEYVIGPKTHAVISREDETIEKLLNDIRRAHRRITIERIKTESAELRMDQRVAEIVGQKVIVAINPLVEVRLLYRGVERTMIATSTWTQVQFTDAAKAPVGERGEKFLARRVGAEKEAWEVRAGHTYELVETSLLTLKLYRKTKEFVEIKLPGTASIGEVAEQVSRHLKLPAWENVTIKRMDGKSFWLENAGKYQVE